MTKIPNENAKIIKVLEAVLRDAKNAFDYDRAIHRKIAELRKISFDESVAETQRNFDRETAGSLIRKGNEILERLMKG